MPGEAGFTFGRAESIGANTANSLAVTVTASGTANAYGSWATLGTTTFEYNSIIVYAIRGSAAADYVLDLGIDDGAGNVFVIAGSLRAPNRKAADYGYSYALPLRVPAGKALVARVACNTASASILVSVTGMSRGPRGITGYSRCLPLYTAATSRGVTVDPGGTANTKGSWAQLVASTAFETAAVMLCVGHNADSSRTAAASALLDIGVGSAGNEFALIPNIPLGWTTTSDTPVPAVVGPFECCIPQGRRVAARMQCTDTTAGDRTIDVGAWAFVP